MSVDFAVPAEVAFDFLVDPRNRPLWQSSLKRVEAVDPAEPAVGQTWVDVTTPGMRPAMETTELERPHRWTERGHWRGITAELTLTFTETATGCTVHADVAIDGAGVLGPVLRRAAALAVPRDLARAGRQLN